MSEVQALPEALKVFLKSQFDSGLTIEEILENVLTKKPQLRGKFTKTNLQKIFKDNGWVKGRSYQFTSEEGAKITLLVKAGNSAIEIQKALSVGKASPVPLQSLTNYVKVNNIRYNENSTTNYFRKNYADASEVLASVFSDDDFSDFGDSIEDAVVVENEVEVSSESGFSSGGIITAGVVVNEPEVEIEY